MILENSIGVAGYFQITKIDRNGNLIEYPEQKNLILDNWFKAFFNQNCTTVENTQAKPYNGLSVHGIALGTGTDPVNPTDHKLTNMVLGVIHDIIMSVDLIRKPYSWIIFGMGRSPIWPRTPIRKSGFILGGTVPMVIPNSY